MTTVPIWADIIDENNTAVKLARYAQIIQLPEDQFWGVNNSATLLDKACSPIWTLPMRQLIARYLAEAQEEIEQVVGYPLCPRWIFEEHHPYETMSVVTEWGKLLDVGIQGSTLISAGVAVSYATDPSTVVVATTVTDTDELFICYPGTTIQIMPSSITLAGGNATFSIPRARLVERSSIDNPDTGWTYSDVPPSATSPFLTTVDVYRIYNDDSTQAGIIYPHRATSGSDCSCGCSAGCLTCGSYTETACEWIRSPEIGVIDILPASYASAAWTSACPICYCTAPEYVIMSYKAGLETLTKQLEDAVVRLAHSKMPSPPCGCGVANEIWARDRNVPATVTSERLNNPFGQSDGAFFAWRQALAARLQRGLSL